MKSTQEMEQPAKQWQMEAINTEMKAVNVKLDNLLSTQNGYASQSQLKEIEDKSKAYTDSQLNVLKAKYDPLYKLFWALMTAVLVQAAFLVYQLLIDRPGA